MLGLILAPININFPLKKTRKYHLKFCYSMSKEVYIHENLRLSKD